MGKNPIPAALTHEPSHDNRCQAQEFHYNSARRESSISAKLRYPPNPVIIQAGNQVDWSVWAREVI